MYPSIYALCFTINIICYETCCPWQNKLIERWTFIGQQLQINYTSINCVQMYCTNYLVSWQLTWTTWMFVTLVAKIKESNITSCVWIIIFLLLLLSPQYLYPFYSFTTACPYISNKLNMTLDCLCHYVFISFTKHIS